MGTSSSSVSTSPEWKKRVGAGARSLSESSEKEMDASREQAASSIHAVQYRKGGKVRKMKRKGVRTKERA
jgi:hypothetical protein